METMTVLALLYQETICKVWYILLISTFRFSFSRKYIFFKKNVLKKRAGGKALIIHSEHDIKYSPQTRQAFRFFVSASLLY